MKDTFEELVKLSRVADKCDPWMRQNSIEGYCEEINGEIEEVLCALKNNDMENLKEELGDVFLDLARLCVVAERRGHFDIAEILEHVVLKIKERQPFLLEGRAVTKEESHNLWMQAKAREKQEKENKKDKKKPLDIVEGETYYIDVMTDEKKEKKDESN
ncbi:MAG: MazG nucleotide pyrophosphohydrolase domain-containing protein [Nanoarchaeota archaeon]